MARLPTGGTTGTLLLEELLNQRRPPRTLSNLAAMDEQAVEDALLWISDNLDVALAAIKKGPAADAVAKRFTDKLAAKFHDTFAEARCIAQLDKAGFVVSVEPTHPASGSDVHVLIGAQTVEVEVVAILGDELEQASDVLINDVKTALKGNPLHISFTHVPAALPKQPEYRHGLIKTLRQIVVDVAQAKVRLPASLFWSPSESRVVSGFTPQTNFDWRDRDHPANHPNSYDFICTIHAVPGAKGPFIGWHGGFESNDYDRHRRKIKKKRAQLSGTQPGVVFLDVSSDGELGLDGFGLDVALNGSLEAAVQDDGEGGTRVVSARAKDGLFNASTGLSGVVTSLWGFVIDPRSFERVLVRVGKVFANPSARHPCPPDVLAALKTPLP